MEGGTRGTKLIDILLKDSIAQINNSDTICQSRAIIVCLALCLRSYFNWITGRQWTDLEIRYIREGRYEARKNQDLQMELANWLHHYCQVPIRDQGNDLEDLKLFEHKLKIRIVVYTSNNKDGQLYIGNANYKTKTRTDDSIENSTIYLYMERTMPEGNHFHSIRNINGFLGTRYFCEECLKPYAHKPHKCESVCECCYCVVSTEMEIVMENL